MLQAKHASQCIASILLPLAIAFPVDVVCAETKLVSHAIKGVVVEEGTGKPIANAVVSAKWNGGWSSLLSGGTICLRAAATRTDEAGRFQFPAFVDGYSSLVAYLVAVLPYKPGYQYIQPGYGLGVRKKILWVFERDEFEIPATEVRLEMKAFSGSDQQRADFLASFLNSTRCRESAEVSSMGLLYNAMLVEVSQMPSTAWTPSNSLNRRTLRETIEVLLSRTQEPRATWQVDYPK
jgi:hypothetical protein